MPATRSHEHRQRKAWNPYLYSNYHRHAQTHNENQQSSNSNQIETTFSNPFLDALHKYVSGNVEDIRTQPLRRWIQFNRSVYSHQPRLYFISDDMPRDWSYIDDILWQYKIKVDRWVRDGPEVLAVALLDWEYNQRDLYMMKRDLRLNRCLAGINVFWGNTSRQFTPDPHIFAYQRCLWEAHNRMYDRYHPYEAQKDPKLAEQHSKVNFGDH